MIIFKAASTSLILLTEVLIYNITRDLPGIALVITLLMYGDFSTKMHQIAMLFIFTKLSQLVTSKVSTAFLGNLKDLLTWKVHIITHQGQENQTVRNLSQSSQ